MTDTTHHSPSQSPAPSSKQLLEDRIQARRLLKQLRSDNKNLARKAAQRFRTLRTLNDSKIEDVLAQRDRLQLKHALAVLAEERGFTSWKDRKTNTGVVDDKVLMYAYRMDVLLNRWFAHYDEARESLAEQGGFLLPYKHQFFICEAEGIRILGLDPEDPDWQKIGWNWVEPLDLEAHGRLRAKRLKVALARRR